MSSPEKLTYWQRYSTLQRQYESMSVGRVQPEYERIISELLYLSHEVLTEIDEGWRPLFNKTFKPREIKPMDTNEKMSKVADILVALRYQRVISSPTRPPPTSFEEITPLLNMADTNPSFIQLLHDIVTGRNSGDASSGS